MSPTSYRAAPPRVSEDFNYSKASMLRQTLSTILYYRLMIEVKTLPDYPHCECVAQRYNRRPMKALYSKAEDNTHDRY
jgi:hypothetical protein